MTTAAPADTTPQAKKKKADPDNVFVTPGRKDPDQVFVFVPRTYRNAQAALKEAGAVYAGSQWGMDKESFGAQEATIRAAARADIDLGPDGRAEREANLKAAQSPEPADQVEASPSM